MNAIAQWLKEKGKIVIPKTLDTQVFDENGKSLDRRLKTAKDEQVIQLPKVNPTLIVSDLNYSTEEQLTGKRWIDGKPIYQKSFEFETGDGAQSRTIYEDQNAFLVDINSNMNNVTEGSYYKYIEPYNTDGLKISFIQSSQYSNKTYNITIQYTKKTDTASSPVAPPKVEAMHVYSTEEKVVGTWIDGKPLYEVTFSGNELSIPNVDHLHIIQSMAHSSTYDNYDPIPMPSYGVRWMFSKTNENLTVNDPTDFHDGYITTIQYTKTTDTATT